MAPHLNFKINVIPRVNIHTYTPKHICIVQEMKEGTGIDRKRAVAVKESARICFRSIPVSVDHSQLSIPAFLIAAYNRIPNPLGIANTVCRISNSTAH